MSEIYLMCWNCGKFYPIEDVKKRQKDINSSVICMLCDGFIVTPNGKVSMSGTFAQVVAPKIKNPDITDCKLIKHNKEELGKPKRYKNNLCEGYAIDGGEPHDKCKVCKSFEGYDKESN